MEYVLNVLQAVVGIINEMSPYLLLGFILAGVMHAFIPNGWYTKYLSGNTIKSVINAAIFGIPLPLCSCGVIPTATSLYREGASKGAVVSFLVATPQTGVDSIIATYSLMGLPFAIVRPIAALFTAVVSGSLVTFLQSKDIKKDSESNKKQEEAHCHQCNEKHGFWGKCYEAIKFGFIELMEDIGKWLVIGLIIAGLITVLVPDDFFSIFKDNTALSILLVLCISIPMYICATGSIPIAVALILKGLTPGAALVMLIAGPACNLASIFVINKVLGNKALALYITAIILGSVLFGIGIDYLLPREWFINNLMISNEHEHGAGWFEWICTGTLILLLLNVVRIKLQHKQPTCSCHCNHDHD
ncbi:MAG: SO_0444 family Cu/Zn efflux transporter [Bacteroidaceae bacterium]|nr:SO_0444 family Cu/Zn efflux transporter [Bacteroidaceae bacterium]